MIYSPVAGRYARALLDVAIDLKKEEEYKKLLSIVVEVYRSLKIYLDDPTLSSERKFSILIDTLERLGVELDRPFENFLKIVLEKKRQKHLPAILKLYEDLEIESKGKIPADLIAPYDLSDEEIDLLKRFVKKHALREPVFRFTKDESLIAGVKLEFEGLTYDISVKGRLERIYREVFKEG